jgi:anti-sigma-K factor RskA
VTATEPPNLHDLAAGYALDALDDSERAAFEEHLAGCEACSEEVRAFHGAASMLAYAEQAPEPPAALRSRLLERAKQERPTQSVVVLRPRRAFRVAALAAAAAVLVAVGLGVWAASLSNSLDAERTARAADARAVAILADSAAQRLPLGPGEVVRGRDGASVVVMRDMPAAPDGKTYEAWVIEGGVPLRAGVFEGGKQEIVLLERPLPDGAIVAVTLEPEGGLDTPTGDVLVGSEPA